MEQSLLFLEAGRIAGSLRMPRWRIWEVSCSWRGFGSGFMAEGWTIRVVDENVGPVEY